ncbi:winged helix-turn-helix transcriptional regulator [Dietzia sp. CQ4]|uniref:ArsR/SmtB family transcription factor n=1 Tax=Dietzia sp. (strain CQ4) TaxID=370437 RepID=UPI0015FCC71A|nr:metalloregulator ArsR/SmtB family transcription factor [Dietzia sp. CQ4]MBB1034916.1 winged helix-turn-helix transcriptional regulator [Dietzia sp. CQ4]
MDTPRSSVFDALADPTRREILLVLSVGELSVGDIADHISGLGRTTISSHLRILRMAGLVKERREGRYRRYSVDPAPALQLVEFMTHVYKDSLQELTAAAVPAEADREAGSQAV